MPVVTVLTLEYAPATKARFYYHHHVQWIPIRWSASCALLGMSLIPSLGWRAMFWVGAIPLLLVVPLAIRLFPDHSFLMAKGRKKEVEDIAERFKIPIGGELGQITTKNIVQKTEKK